MKALIWILAAKKDLMKLPKSVIKSFGYGLYQAEQGLHPDGSKVLTGFGSTQIVELREDGEGGTYRTIYTAQFREIIIVLHVFQKKSSKGIKTPKKEMDLLHARLKRAEEIYKEWKEKQR